MINYLLGEEEYLKKALTGSEVIRIKASEAEQVRLEKAANRASDRKLSLRRRDIDIMKKALNRFRDSCEHDTRNFTGSKLGYGDEREEYEYSKCVKCGYPGGLR